VREADPLDLDEVVALRLALLRDPTATPGRRLLRPDAELVARKLYAKQLRSRHEVTLLAELSGKVVGIVRVAAAPASPLHAEFRHAYLSSAFVRPAARRRGVLRALVAHAMAWCEAHGVSEVRLHSAVGNAAAARAWQALGFDVSEELRRRPLVLR
jgi:ribosomal protein S18 acetylase RimI-like enzyme